MKLHDRLILNKYFLSLFDVGRFADLRSESEKEPNLRDILFNVEEDFKGLDNTNYLNSILFSKLDLDKELKAKIESYDKNIRGYLDYINQKRDEPIILTYFQYLSILFTEVFLDRYYNSREDFIVELNKFVKNENKKIHENKNKYSYFHEKDLNKLAFYMATGSGKTLIMHINCLQFKKYCNKDINNIILITPNSDLSIQHIGEFKESSIDAKLFIDNSMGFKKDNMIFVIEITKLVKDKEGSGESIEISSLEDNNLILVDEGHRGSTGEIWKTNREELAKKGFIFEYSATFGQAVQGQIHKSDSWNNESDYYSQRIEDISLDKKIKKDLFRINKGKSYINISKYELEEKIKEYKLTKIQGEKILNCYDNNFEDYSKSIIFDYSYKYFHMDGYGKDYNIMNLKSDSFGDYNHVYLLGNLLSFYEQKKYFIENQDKIKEYNLEKPLLMFVGHTVSSTGRLTIDDKASISDIGFILEFIHNFIVKEKEIIGLIKDILDEKSGLIDSNGRDIFIDNFKYLKEEEYTSKEIYVDILKEIFNCKSNTKGRLELYDIKQTKGEVGLKIKGSEDYFGLVNIGDVNRFRKHLEEHDFIWIMEDDFSESYFERINNPDSEINILIGAKKFTEGWNSYRVSNIGLLNIGVSAGSQIIQIFGRGVRLRGLNGSLKRSGKLPIKLRREHPDNIEILEILNVFGIRADYMKEFEEYLRAEDITVDRIREIELKIKVNKEFLNKDLAILKLEEGINFKNDINISLSIDDTQAVEVDLRPKVEKITSDSKNIDENKKSNVIRIKEKYLEICDWDKIFLEIVKYKRLKGFWNLIIEKDTLKEIIKKEKYNLYCNPNDVNPERFQEISNLENIIITIIKKYINSFYRNNRLKYEDGHLVYGSLDETSGNFKDYIIKVKEDDKVFLDNIIKLAENEQIYKKEFKDFKNVCFKRHLFQPLLCESDKFTTVPVGLNNEERNFVIQLKEYLETAEFKKLCKGKEVFLLRNLSIGNGVGFFEADNFHPDFILWIKEQHKQYITFLDPKGILMLGSLNHPKIQLAKTIKDREKKLKSYKDDVVILNSFIISNTNLNDVRNFFKKPHLSRDDFLEKNIIFEEDTEGIDKLFRKILKS